MADRYQMEAMLNHTTKPIIFVTYEFGGCIDDAYFFLLFFFITSGPTHCSTNLHHSMHPKSSFGFATHFLQSLHRLLVSSLKNSINTPHEGHLTSKISPGFQWRVSCPGHFMSHNILFFSVIFKVDIGSIRTTSKSIFV